MQQAVRESHRVWSLLTRQHQPCLIRKDTVGRASSGTLTSPPPRRVHVSHVPAPQGLDPSRAPTCFKVRWREHFSLPSGLNLPIQSKLTSRRIYEAMGASQWGLTGSILVTVVFQVTLQGPDFLEICAEVWGSVYMKLEISTYRKGI